VSLDGERTTSRTERVGDAEVYRLRGRLLPLVRLDHALAIRRNGQSVDTSSVIAVLEADGRRFGLLVDKVLDTEEIVVKPVSGIMKELGLYSGATILGDGAVSLILDVQNIARRYLRSGESVDSQVADVAVADVADSRQLLIVRIGANRRVAVPLEVVTRLEEFPVADIEQVGRRQVVRYRGGILPLIRLSEHLNAGYGEARDVVPGVVYSLNGRSVALAAEEIIDIVSEASVTRSDLDDFGLVGSAVIRDRVTELLDVRTAILAADPMFYDDRSGHGINRAIPDSQGAWA